MKVSSSYTASGIATGAMPAMNVSTGSINSTRHVARNSNRQVKKKQLNYNPRELSSAILRAHKAQAAGRVTAMAKMKLSSLLKCKGTGQYNEGELATAIAHAKAMVRCGQLKTQNLRQEEREKKHFEAEVKAELRQEKNKIKARVARKERDLEQKSSVERMNRVQKEKSQKRELMRKKKFHRSHERSKLNEADMDYLKQKIHDMRSEGSAAETTPGVTLDLSAEAMQMTDVQLQAQIAAEMEAAGGEMGGAAMADIGSAGMSAPSATSINIAI